MISAERLRVIVRACKADKVSLGDAADLAFEVIAARARIADLDKYLEQAQFREIELREQLRAQELSQEDREACLAGAACIEGNCIDTDAAAILRRLGGQTI